MLLRTLTRGRSSVRYKASRPYTAREIQIKQFLFLMLKFRWWSQMFQKILLNRRNTRQAVFCFVTQWLLPMEKRCVTPISLQATVMRIKKSLFFLTESLMRSIAGRFYHFREHVFQKETRVDSSIIFQHVPDNTHSSQIPSLPHSRFWDVTQRSQEALRDISSRGGMFYSFSLRGNPINFRGNKLTQMTSCIH